MGDSIELTLDYPIPDADWDKIMDTEFEKTKNIFFRTKSGKTVEFVKVSEELEKPNGTWRHYEGEITCSECGSSFYDEIMDLCGSDVPKFCPDCGAVMTEEEWLR